MWKWHDTRFLDCLRCLGDGPREAKVVADDEPLVGLVDGNVPNAGHGCKNQRRGLCFNKV